MSPHLSLTGCAYRRILTSGGRFLHGPSWKYFCCLGPGLHDSKMEYHISNPDCSRHFSTETLRHYYSPEFPPVGYAQKFLELIYDNTGLPWWATILVATVTLRTFVTTPLIIYSHRNMVKLIKLTPELKEKSEELRMEVASAIKMYKWDAKTAHYWYKKNMIRIAQEMYVRDNCHPLKNSVVFIMQIPIWLGTSLALRNISGRTPFTSTPFLEAVHPEMSHEGILWFTNLMTPDSYFILPVLCGFANLLNVEVAALGRSSESKMQRYITHFYRGVGLIVVPLGLILPSCMVYYWTCSALCALASTLVMKHPGVKKLLGIPSLPGESRTPYRDMYSLAKNKVSRQNKNK